MTASRRYRAFISYSHSDERWARWLQRALENYRLPKTLHQQHAGLPARLYPLFRDRDELASAHDLSESIQRAMDDSDALVVICSPSARGSHWVNQEIRRFRQSDRGERIFCLLVSGSPDPQAPDCAFPPALLFDDAGNAQPEPLAADATPRGDGKRNAMLKIAAGLLGVGVDELKRRDAQRQARFWSFVALGSALVAATTIGLAIYAFNAKQESELRRQQAEGLIGFMLGDLREKLEPIGKLELLDAVGDQATAYFASLGDHGTPKEMLARAVALKQIGDVRFNQGELEPALSAFKQSLAQAEALHRAEPSNNDYLYELGQAEFWVGYVAWQRGDMDQAESYMQRYLEYSEQLARREPGNVDYQLEVSYAQSNLGALANALSQPAKALEKFRLSAAIGEKLLRDDPDNVDLAMNFADTVSWIATTQLNLGLLQVARREFNRAAGIMQPFHAQGKDQRASDYYGRLLVAQAEADLNAGALDSARAALDQARSIYAKRIHDDPSNIMLQSEAIKPDLFLLSLEPPARWNEAERAALAGIQQRVVELLADAPGDSALIAFQAHLRWLQLASALGRTQPAELLQSAEGYWHDWQESAKDMKMTPDLQLTGARLAEVLGRIRALNGDIDGARSLWLASDARMQSIDYRDPSFIALQRQLALDLGRLEKAAELDALLLKAGYADPRMQATADSPR